MSKKKKKKTMPLLCRNLFCVVFTDLFPNRFFLNLLFRECPSGLVKSIDRELCEELWRRREKKDPQICGELM